MLSIFRKFQKELLIAVTIIIIIAFAFWGDFSGDSSASLGSTNCVVKVDGRCYRLEEAQKLARFQSLAFNLGMRDFANTMRGENRMDMDPTDFVMNLIVLRKQAEKMGIEPSVDEINAAAPNLPIFKQVPWANSRFLENLLGQQGLHETDLEQLIKDYLSYEKLQNLIGAGIQAVPSQIEKAYIAENQRYTASIVNFDRKDFLAKATISDEEIKSYYDDRNGDKAIQPALDIAETPDGVKPVAPKFEDKIMTAPKRAFDFVKFMATELAEDATEEQKAKSNVNFAKGVNRIYAELADDEADFSAVAKEFAGKENDFKMEIGAFEPFEIVDAPQVLQSNGTMLSALFSGTLEQGEVSVPHADGANTYYVFRLSEQIRPRPMTFDDAKEIITAELKIKKSSQLASDAANEALAKLQTAVDAGKSILDAASANSYNLVSLPNFSDAERPADTPDSNLILKAVSDAGAGQLSKVMERPQGAGYFISYVDKIEIYKDADKDSKLRALAASSVLEQKTKMFKAWFKQQAKALGAQRNNSILAYPGSR